MIALNPASGGRNIRPQQPLLGTLISACTGRFRVACLIAFVTVVVVAPPRTEAHGSFHEEAARLEARIRETPADAGLWYQLGWVYLLHGDWQQSLLDVEKAERLAPGRRPYGFVRAKALAAGGKLEPARAVLDDFLKDHPEHAGAWIERAHVLRRLGRLEESVSDLRLALAKTPNPEPDLYIELGQALVERLRPDEAVQVLEAGVTKIGRVPSLVLKLVQVEAASGMLERALARLQMMEKTAPRAEPWMAERARLLARAGCTGDSQAAWLSLRDHIESLPELERASHAMSTLLEQACGAVSAPKVSSETGAAAIVPQP